MFRINKTLMLTLVVLFSQGTFLHAENLYDEKSFQALVSDRKAFRVGDSLTVVVVEAAKAVSRAGTGSEGSTDISAGSKDNDFVQSGSFSLGAQSGGDAVTSRHGFL